MSYTDHTPECAVSVALHEVPLDATGRVERGKELIRAMYTACTCPASITEVEGGDK